MCLPSIGASRGIWVIWDASRVKMVESQIGLFSVLIRCKLKSLEVYGT